MSYVVNKKLKKKFNIDYNGRCNIIQYVESRLVIVLISNVSCKLYSDVQLSCLK